MSERCGCRYMPPYEDSMLEHPYPIGQGEIVYCPTHAAAFDMLEAIKDLKALLPKEATATESYMFRCGMTEILKKLTP